MYFSPIHPNGHTANASNNHHSLSITHHIQHPIPPPGPLTNRSPDPSPQQHPPRRKPTTNILQYILNRRTATLTSPTLTNTPTIHGNPHNHQLTATITRPNTNRASTNNNATRPRHHMTSTQPPAKANTPDKTTNANSNITPPNINTIHHCHPTETELTTNINSPTFPSHRTNNMQAPTIDTNINSTSNTDNEPTNSILNSMTSTINAIYNGHPTVTALFTNLNSTTSTDNKTDNSHPSAMCTMDTHLYSPNLLSTSTPDCEAVPDAVG